MWAECSSQYTSSSIKFKFIAWMKKVSKIPNRFRIQQKSVQRCICFWYLLFNMKTYQELGIRKQIKSSMLVSMLNALLSKHKSCLNLAWQGFAEWWIYAPLQLKSSSNLSLGSLQAQPSEITYLIHGLLSIETTKCNGIKG